MRFKLLTAVFLASGLAAHAATLTYTQTVNATGTLNNVAFTNALLTLQATADSNAVTSNGATQPIYTAPTLSFGGSVAGLGAFTLATGSIFDNQRQGNAGFSLASGADIFDISGPIFSNYDLKGATTLITGTTFYIASTQTSAGYLSISNYASTATYQAQIAAPAVTPEPSSFALLATGLVGIGGLLRKRLA